MSATTRVLVVDDDHELTRSLQGQLRHLGYDVAAVVHDGLEAVEACRLHEPDLVLMDIELPGLDGLSASQDIVHNLKIPVIILTAYGKDAMIEQAVQIGVANYIIKPITSESLHAIISVTLERERQLQERERQLQDSLRLLEDRKKIERAKGILTKYNHISEDEAYRQIQQASQRRKVKMAILAESIIEAHALLASFEADPADQT